MDERRTSYDRRQLPRGGRRHPDHDGRPVILIVDDHVDSREFLAAVLKEIGMTTTEAGTGTEAVRRASAFPTPSLIFVDLTLPDCHGTEVVRTLKDDPATSEIPVVALSASVRTTDKEAAARAGCTAFLEKPVLPDDVIDIVRRLITGASA